MLISKQRTDVLCFSIIIGNGLSAKIFRICRQRMSNFTFPSPWQQQTLWLKHKSCNPPGIYQCKPAFHPFTSNPWVKFPAIIQFWTTQKVWSHTQEECHPGGKQRTHLKSLSASVPHIILKSTCCRHVIAPTTNGGTTMQITAMIVLLANTNTQRKNPHHGKTS